MFSDECDEVGSGDGSGCVEGSGSGQGPIDGEGSRHGSNDDLRNRIRSGEKDSEATISTTIENNLSATSPSNKKSINANVTTSKTTQSVDNEDEESYEDMSGDGFDDDLEIGIEYDEKVGSLENVQDTLFVPPIMDEVKDMDEMTSQNHKENVTGQNNSGYTKSDSGNRSGEKDSKTVIQNDRIYYETDTNTNITIIKNNVSVTSPSNNDSIVVSTTKITVTDNIISTTQNNGNNDVKNTIEINVNLTTSKTTQSDDNEDVEKSTETNVYTNFLNNL
ncbi:myb-like protein D [Aphidius gifuensis]|uniref:myb-like protein D n=1 Tax=Aphidius gifuensis TaxID=684658 RepID=UPI001CDC09B9|nr:myb-like protein D [Aphidius gifuensis]